MLSDQDLAAIEERYSKVSPGPWTSGEYGGDAGSLVVWDAKEREVAVVYTDAGLEHEPASDDAAFIASSREDVPKLLEEVKRLRGINVVRNVAGPTPLGYRELSGVYSNGVEIVVAAGRGGLPDDHNCDALGCGSVSHVSARFSVPEGQRAAIEREVARG